MKEEIKRRTDSLGEDLTEFLREIVAIPSFSAKETEVIERLGREMAELDYDEVTVDPMGNLIGRIGSGDRILAIDGHCDTVGVGNPDSWEVDPFGAVFRDGVVYGRGASDQKGGLASAVYSGGVLKRIGVPDDVSVIVTASVLEEDYEGLCWDHIIREGGIVPEAVLLTEPTGMQIHIGQRGRLEIEIETQGVSCHGSAPERGENAIYKIAPVILDIERLNARLASDSPLGKGTVTVTDIRSTAPSLCAVADSATLHLDRRLTEGETLESALEEIAVLESVWQAGARLRVPECEVESHTGLKYPAKAYFPPWLMREGDPLVVSAVEAYRSQFGMDTELGVWAFSTNGVATMGIHGIPSLGFGPGEEKHAHTPADQVKAEDVIRSAEYYAAFALRWAEG